MPLPVGCEHPPSVDADRCLIAHRLTSAKHAERVSQDKELLLQMGIRCSSFFTPIPCLLAPLTLMLVCLINSRVNQGHCFGGNTAHEESRGERERRSSPELSQLKEV